ANARLRGGGDFVATPSRFLGHYVVGELARETSIQVELLPSPVTGVTARVTLPASALATPLPIERGEVADAVPRHAALRQPVPARPGPAPLALPPSVATTSVLSTARKPEVPARDQAVQPPAVVGGEAIERTPNGLRKRIPRERRLGPSAAAGVSSLTLEHAP